jgi:hypothetical protein
MYVVSPDGSLICEGRKWMAFPAVGRKTLRKQSFLSHLAKVLEPKAKYFCQSGAVDVQLFKNRPFAESFFKSM